MQGDFTVETNISHVLQASSQFPAFVTSVMRKASEESGNKVRKMSHQHLSAKNDNGITKICGLALHIPILHYNSSLPILAIAQK